MAIDSSIMAGLISVGVSAVVALITAYASTQFRLGKTTGHVEAIVKRLDRLENKIDEMYKGFFTPKNETSKELAIFIDKLDKILNSVKTKGNPISREEIERFRTYSAKLGTGVPLTSEEYLDFDRLSKKIRDELPEKQKEEFDWVLAGLFGFLLGLALATAMKKSNST